jgi:hypothetical protein
LLLRLLYKNKGGGATILLNFYTLIPDYAVPHPRRQHTLYAPLSVPHIKQSLLDPFIDRISVAYEQHVQHIIDALSYQSHAASSQFYSIKKCKPTTELFYSNSSSCTMALMSTQSLTEMSTWNLQGGRRVRLSVLPQSVSRFSRENMGASTSHNPMGLHGLLQG